MLKLKNIGKCRIMFEDKNNNNIIMKSGEIKDLDIDADHNFIKEGLLAEPIEVQAEISSSKILGLEEQISHLKENLKAKDDEIENLKENLKPKDDEIENLKEQIKNLKENLKKTKKSPQNNKESNLEKLKAKADSMKKEKEAE